MINSLNNSAIQRIAKILKKSENKEYDKVIDEVIIKYVDGEEIRGKEIEFSLAGHYYRYPKLIPENEIWIESGIDKTKDLTAILVHELAERLSMKLLKIDYDEAHEEIADPSEESVRDFSK